MKYAHLVYSLFGVPAHQWDDLPYSDLRWMIATADRHAREQEKQNREAGRG